METRFNFFIFIFYNFESNAPDFRFKNACHPRTSAGGFSEPTARRSPLSREWVNFEINVTPFIVHIINTVSSSIKQTTLRDPGPAPSRRRPAEVERTRAHPTARKGNIPKGKAARVHATFSTLTASVPFSFSLNSTSPNILP